ncbi:hypothetical protein FACS1894110_20900 [Spirochaetia bacterium]|nr:hypothetical protein FACS1894110_20900 [Spirochaetia bacterium]
MPGKIRGCKTILPLHEGDTADYSDRKGMKIITLKIDAGVTAIRACFAHNELTDLAIPDSVTTIAEKAFMKNRLESIDIPDSVTAIGADAFRSNRLKRVKLSESLEGIGDGAFRDNKLKSIVLPAGLKWIGDTAFKGNPITSITIGEYLEGRDENLTPSSIPYADAFGNHGVEFINCYVHNNTAAGTYEYDRAAKKWYYVRLEKKGE